AAHAAGARHVRPVAPAAACGGLRPRRRLSRPRLARLLGSCALRGARVVLRACLIGASLLAAAAVALTGAVGARLLRGTLLGAGRAIALSGLLRVGGAVSCTRIGAISRASVGARVLVAAAVLPHLAAAGIGLAAERVARGGFGRIAEALRRGA